MTFNVEFQGYTCGPVFEVNRTTGLEPDFAAVHIAKVDLKKLEISEPKGGLEAVAYLTALETPASGLSLMGDLRVEEFETPEKGHVVVFRHMILSQRTIESAFVTHDSQGVVKIELTDIRELWKDRGRVYAWANVPFRGIAVAQGSTVSDQKYVPGSTDGGKPFTFARYYAEKIRPVLPGKPPATFFPVKLGETVIQERKDQGKLARKVLEELLRETKSVIALNPDCSVSFWRRGEGELQDTNGQKVVYTLDGNAKSWDPRIASVRELVTRYHVPNKVTVLGQPTVETKVDELVPVAEVIDPQGKPKIISLDEFLGIIGAPLRLVFIEHDKRVALSGIGAEGLRQFEKCAGRWYAVPGVLEGLYKNVPVEDAADTNAQGGRGPPTVMASSAHPMRVSQILRLRGQHPEVAKLLEEAQDAERKKQASAQAQVNAPAGKGTELSKEEKERRKKELEEAKEAAANVGAEEFIDFLAGKLPPPAAPGPVGGAGGPGEAGSAARLLSGSGRDFLVRVGNSPNPIAVFNMPPTQASGGEFELDRKRGIVMFASHRVVAETEGKSPHVTVAKPARVVMRYGVMRHPTGEEPLALTDRYVSTWERVEDPTGLSADAEKGRDAGSVRQVQPDMSCVVVEANLQELVRLDGTSNRGSLDGTAQRIAMELILPRRLVQGAVVEFCRPVALRNTGRVLSIKWTYTDKGPLVTAHDSRQGRFSPQRAGGESVLSQLRSVFDKSLFMNESDD